MKKTLITDITNQGNLYLIELVLFKRLKSIRKILLFERIGLKE